MKYKFMSADSLQIPDDVLIISWESTPNGYVLNLDYSSTKDEKTAYAEFVEAVNQAANDYVIPEILNRSYWYLWEDILKNSHLKQYSIVYSVNGEIPVYSLHWDSHYDQLFSH